MASIAAVELADSLKDRWENADYSAKRTNPEIVCESARLNPTNFEIRLNKPFRSRLSSEFVSRSGAEESRTPDLIIANDALYQLSYRPVYLHGVPAVVRP